MKPSQRYLEISRLLRPHVKLAVRQVLPLYLERVRYLQDPQSVYRAALSVLKFRFPNASPVEADVLAMTLAGFAVLMKEWEGTKEELEDLVMEHQIKLQMFMDRRLQIDQMLSNIMKKSSEVSASIIANMK